MGCDGCRPSAAPAKGIVSATGLVLPASRSPAGHYPILTIMLWVRNHSSGEINDHGIYLD
jgi:hypothetical protein